MEPLHTCQNCKSTDVTVQRKGPTVRALCHRCRTVITSTNGVRTIVPPLVDAERNTERNTERSTVAEFTTATMQGDYLNR